MFERLTNTVNHLAEEQEVDKTSQAFRDLRKKSRHTIQEHVRAKLSEFDVQLQELLQHKDTSSAWAFGPRVSWMASVVLWRLSLRILLPLVLLRLIMLRPTAAMGRLL